MSFYFLVAVATPLFLGFYNSLKNAILIKRFKFINTEKYDFEQTNLNTTRNKRLLIEVSVKLN